MTPSGTPKPSFRARINRNSRKLGLPVPVSGLARFSIKGVWRKFEEEGPDPTVVILKCRARIAKRTTEHRLTGDAAFPMPEGTEFAELEVLYPSDYASLEVSITPIERAPNQWRAKPERPLSGARRRSKGKPKKSLGPRKALEAMVNPLARSTSRPVAFQLANSLRL